MPNPNVIVTNLGTGGAKAPPGYEYGPQGQIQPIVPPAPTPVVTPTATYGADPVSGVPYGSPDSNNPNPASVTKPAPVVAPTVTAPSTTPTVGEIYGSAGGGDLGSAYQQEIDRAKAASNMPDPNDPTVAAGIRSSILNSFQGEIDAQNSVYGDKLAQAVANGRARLGTNTAIQARSGMLGSDFGAGATAAVRGQNTQEQNTVLDEKGAAVQAILEKARTQANQDIKDKTAARQAGLDDYIKYLSANTDRQKTNAGSAAQVLLSQGHAVTDLDPASLQAVLSGYGITKEQLISAYNEAKPAYDQAQADAASKAQEEADKHNAAVNDLNKGQVLSPGQAIVAPDGTVIKSLPAKDTYQVVKGSTITDALGNSYQTPDRVFNATTGEFVGTTISSGGGSGAGGGGGGVTLPSGGGTGGGLGTTATPSSDLRFSQYGLLGNTDFNPSNTLDNLAQSYLDKYIKNGTVPTASTLGRGIKPAGFAQVESRARDLYFKATGNPLPTPQIIKQQQELIESNNRLTNNLKIQEGTVQKNVDLSLDNLKKNGLNATGFKPLDSLFNTVLEMFNDPHVGQLIAQNSTIQNELASLLAVKNNGGTTVHDKLVGAGIIRNDDTEEVVKTKVNALLQEAVNAADTINEQTANAYRITDPLLQDSNNPLRQSYIPKATSDQVKSDIEAAIKDRTTYPDEGGREQLMKDLMSEYGLSESQASHAVYNTWTNNISRQ